MHVSARTRTEIPEVTAEEVAVGAAAEAVVEVVEDRPATTVANPDTFLVNVRNPAVAAAVDMVDVTEVVAAAVIEVVGNPNVTTAEDMDISLANATSRSVTEEAVAEIAETEMADDVAAAVVEVNATIVANPDITRVTVRKGREIAVVVVAGIVEEVTAPATIATKPDI